MSLGITDLDVVYRETCEAHNEWQKILPHLGISSATIASISTECENSPHDCYRRGLAEWLKGEGRHWKDIVEALSNHTVGHSALAKKIEREQLVKDTVADDSVLSVLTQESDSQSAVPERQPSTTPVKDEETDTARTSPLAVAADERTNGCREDVTTSTSKPPVLDELPILDTATPLTDQTPESKPSTCTRAEEITSQRSKDLSGVLTDIDQFAGTKGEERLRFVAAGILDSVDGKSPSDIFRLLLDEHDTCDPFEAEHSQTFAATIFKEALQCAQLPSTRVEALSPFCKACTSKEESLMEKLNFRRELLELGDTIPSEALQRLVGEFTDEQLGQAREDIKTPIQLLQCLLRTRKISPETSSESVQMLEECWQKVKGSPQQTQTTNIQHSGEGSTTVVGGGHPSPKTQNDNDPQLEQPQTPETQDDNDPQLEQPQTPETQDDNDPQLERPQTPDTDADSKCSSQGSENSETEDDNSRLLQQHIGWKTRILQNKERVSCCTCAFTCLLIPFIGVATLTAFSVMSGMHSGQNLSQKLVLYRKTTVLLLNRGLNDQFYKRIKVDLSLLPENRPNALLCQFDCTRNEPRVRTDSLNFSFTSTPRQDDNPERRLVRMFEPISDNYKYNNIYLLEESSIMFTATGINEQFELLIVASHNSNTFSNCYSVLHGSNSSFRRYELNETNGYMANFKVPAGMNGPGAYYCGVIILPSSATVNYSINSQINTYDISYYHQIENVCLDPIPGSAVDHASYATTIGPTINEKYTCVLLAQLKNSLTYLEADVQVTATQVHSNPLFILLLIFAVVCFILVLFTCTCIFTPCCFLCCPRKCMSCKNFLCKHSLT